MALPRLNSANLELYQKLAALSHSVSLAAEHLAPLGDESNWYDEFDSPSRTSKVTAWRGEGDPCTIVSALLATVLSREGEEQAAWLPMELAPKDGTPFIAACEFNEERIFPCRWDKQWRGWWRSNGGYGYTVQCSRDWHDYPAGWIPMPKRASGRGDD